MRNSVFIRHRAIWVILNTGMLGSIYIFGKKVVLMAFRVIHLKSREFTFRFTLTLDSSAYFCTEKEGR